MGLLSVARVEPVLEIVGQILGFVTETPPVRYTVLDYAARHGRHFLHGRPGQPGANHEARL